MRGVDICFTMTWSLVTDQANKYLLLFFIVTKLLYFANDLLDSFPEIQVIDIWKTSDVREDRNNKWFNVLLRKRREEE